MPFAELAGPRHLIAYANPAFCRLVGKSEKALIGRPFAETLQEGDRCMAVLDRVYRTGEAETHNEVDFPEHSPIYWSYAVWPEPDAEQRPVGVMVQVTETSEFHQQAGTMNRELLLSSVRQHEFLQTLEKLNEQLRTEITGRQQAEKAMREGEERARRLEQERAEELERVVEQRTARLRTLALELTRAEEDERRRMAHVLHDQVQPLIVAARIHTSVLLGEAPNSSIQKTAAQIQKILEGALDESRALTYQISPPVLQSSGLPEALRWLGRSMKQAHKLSVAIKIQTSEGGYDETLSVLLFQCARELLLNVVKHAGVHHATVSLRRPKPDLLRLEVKDNGGGFDPAEAQRARVNGGFGLFSIGERLRLLGGQLEVRSAPGQGTRVVAQARLMPGSGAPRTAPKP